ncbi:MAG: excinuclease ABC subunit UvrA [Pirellulales bacterium]
MRDMKTDRTIVLRGVEVHNLQSLDLDLPPQKLIAICGVSGSGKSSLAFDTLYAEGQRRYIESFSAYTRQFLERLEKPAAERIEGLPAAIAVTQGNHSRSNRSTVATATEIHDHLRLLYARIGRIVCHGCGQEIRRDSAQSAADWLATLPPGTRFLVTFKLADEKVVTASTLAKEIARLQASGFQRIIAGGQTWRLADIGSEQLLLLAQGRASQANQSGDDFGWHVVVDRLSTGEAVENGPSNEPSPGPSPTGSGGGRLRDSLESVFQQGQGTSSLWMAEGANAVAGGERGQCLQLDGQPWRRVGFSTRLHCEDCGIDFPPPEPRLFSFNSPLGACPSCEGSGELPICVLQNRWKSYRPCPDCQGARHCPAALAVKVGGRSIAELCAWPVRDAANFLRGLNLTETERSVSRLMLDQVLARLGYLSAVGLDYLPLDRSLRGISGGESQRVALTTALGSSLVNLLYVLDEPTVGLHPADTARLIGVIRGLRDRGNTVVVVDHDEDVIKAADQVVEIGPGAGDRGGQLVFQGTPDEMAGCRESITGDYLSGRREIRPPQQRREPNHGWIRLAGARGHNLQNVTVDFPLGVLCVVTGVSGAGKSTLIEQTLYPAVRHKLRLEADRPLPFDDLQGEGQVSDVMLIDQGPIGRSARSNPVTYIKAFDDIRAVFAETLEARTRNYGTSQFSFNVAGGRCEQCEGQGSIQIDMQFMDDVYMKCPQCRGQRYRREVLDCRYRGKSIADVLEMTIREAFVFFRGQQKLQSRLKQLMDVGLDYVRLGQAANTLSGGEAQRLKLAGYLSSARRARTLFLLDEPTTGLHMHDVARLLDCFDGLLAVGHSLIVVEHNLSFIKCADHIIDLGPGAAAEGGQVVAHGPPEKITECPASITGRYLGGLP